MALSFLQRKELINSFVHYNSLPVPLVPYIERSNNPIAGIPKFCAAVLQTSNKDVVNIHV